MSLYNEVRPNSLTEVRGQEKIVAQIRAILETGNVPNVSLFVGPRGTGKTTVARIFAKAINCEHPSEDGPCNVCKSCKDISSDSSLDVIELDAASNNKVEDVHNLIDSSGYSPLGKYKVYIVDEVHMLSTAAFNALLKLLEEPPAHCRFVLCTTEEHKVPVTILSRCRKFYFERISTSVVAEKMEDICKSRNISYEEEALRLIAKKSEGCMRDAESLLEIFLDAGNVTMAMVSDILGTTSEEIVWNLLNSIATGNIVSSLNIIKEVTDRGKNLQVFVRNLIEALTDLVYYHQSKDLSLIDNTLLYKDKLEEVSSNLSADRALEIASELSDIFFNALKGGDICFLLEAKLLSLASSQSSIQLMKNKLECMEEALYSGITITNISTEEVSDTYEEEIISDSSIEEQISAEENISVCNEVEELEIEPKTLLTPEVKPMQAFGSVLPGDINVPMGTEIKGTVSLFDNDDEDDLPIIIDGFRKVSDEEDIPWSNNGAINSSEEVPEVKIEESIQNEEETKTPAFDPSASLNALGIPTFASFFNL